MDNEIKKEQLIKLETNVDDCSGEALGYAMEKLFDAGALDVWTIPVYMKKNRPASMLSVLCRPEDAERMRGIIFRETTSIGIRETETSRYALPREEMERETPFGPVRAKACRNGAERYVYPEYESVRSLCQRSGCSYAEAENYIRAAFSQDTEEKES